MAVAGIAFARGSNDKPPPKPLADAIAERVRPAPLPKGVTADITFTNNLLPSGTLDDGRSRCPALPASCG